MKNGTLAVLTAACVLAWGAAPATADEPMAKTTKTEKTDKTMAAHGHDHAHGDATHSHGDEMSPEMMAMMELGKAGAEHDWISQMAGNWNAKITFWMEPGAEPGTSEGTSSKKMILGGKYLEDRHTGTAMDHPFEGVGYTAYDNGTKEYVVTWMDSMGTGIAYMTGSREGNVLTTTGESYCPMAKDVVSMKGVTTVVDANNVKYEMWTPDPSGKMFKSLQIDYKRAVSASN